MGSPVLANAGTGPPAHSAPGGISLNQAAAEQLPLNFTLDGAYVQGGKLILTGVKRTTAEIDAALFLTALRAACEDNDPYFSLDPDDMSAWLADTREAETEFDEAIKQDLQWHFRERIRPHAPSILEFHTISASGNYPKLWSAILAKHPALRSRLVFRPEWLRQTRFGEIMYRADVLLKELAGGATALGESQFRATSIDGYRSATERMAALDLLYQYNGWSQQRSVQAGGRIWYDLTESSDTAVGQPRAIPQGNSELRSLLDRRGLLTTAADQSPRQQIATNGGALDLSNVYPRMFVRVRDPVTYADSSARFPGLDELVAQANQTPDRYAAAYSEYEQLVELFRAYIVAVRATQLNSALCSRLPSQLLDTEKVRSPLPAYHPTDLMMTMAWYEYPNGKGRRVIGAPGGLFQGGVSIGADRFLDSTAPARTITPIIVSLNEAAANSINASSWTNNTGREFVAFDVPDAALNSSRVAANSSAAIDALNGGIENAPPPQPLPPASSFGPTNTNIILFVVAVFVFGAVVSARPRRRRR